MHTAMETTSQSLTPIHDRAARYYRLRAELAAITNPDAIVEWIESNWPLALHPVSPSTDTTLADIITRALRGEPGPNDPAVDLWWDTATDCPGPAWRINDPASPHYGSGELEKSCPNTMHLDRSPGDREAEIREYFMGPDNAYLGPDALGYYPNLIP